VRTRLAGLLVGLLLLVAPAAHAARSWDGPFHATASDGEATLDPRFTFTSTGELVALWGGNQGLREMSRPPGGAFGLARTVPSAGMGAPQTVTDGHGGMLIASTDYQSTLSVTHRDPTGALEPTEPINGMVRAWAISSNSRGDAALVFIPLASTGDRDSLYVSFRPAGGTFAPRQLVAGDADQVDTPDVEVLPDGRTLIAWNETTRYADGRSVRTALRQASGQLSAPVTLSTNDPSYVQLDADAQGNAFAVWTEDARSGAPPVAMSYRPSAGGWTLSRQTGGFANRGLALAVSDPGEAILEFAGVQAAGAGAGRPAPLAVSFGSSVTGKLSAPVNVTRGPTWWDGMATNARGDALIWFSDSSHPTAQVIRRAPGGAFGPPAVVRCDGAYFGPPQKVSAGVLSPAGDALLATTSSGPMELFEDHETSTPPPVCPKSSPGPPATRPRQPRPRKGGLHLQARLPHSGHMPRGRTLTVSATCRERCVVRASGAVRIRHRKTPLRYRTAETTYPSAGTRRLRLRLTARQARTLVRSLKRHRRAVAKLRVWARGESGGQRTLVFRVPVWR
jgi:hypothetical protein